LVKSAISQKNRPKKVFSPDIGVEASSQVLAILEYVSGLPLGFALISNENPNFGIGFYRPAFILIPCNAAE